jgi:dihydrofolate reductase
MFINLIVANSQNGVIGKDGNMPWNIPQELTRFQQLTNGSIVIMGRRTYESIGKPLKNRYNFIISQSNLCIKGIYQFSNIEDALKYAKEKLPNYAIFVIGGASIYKQFLEQNLIDRIYQTIIKKDIEGDAVFSFNKENWNIVGDIPVKLLSYKELIDCSYITWERKN